MGAVSTGVFIHSLLTQVRVFLSIVHVVVRNGGATDKHLSAHVVHISLLTNKLHEFEFVSVAGTKVGVTSYAHVCAEVYR